MYCCPECFSDDFIQKHIIANKAKNGICSFCGAKDVPLIEPKKLVDLFLPLFGLYDVDESGKLLDELIQDDWKLFRLNQTERIRLLECITEKNILFDVPYLPVYTVGDAQKEKWEKFREELKHENRFFPENTPERETFRELGQFIGEKINQNTMYLYRARINIGDAIDISNMGKPPKEKVLNGRANPIGIPYLYVASNAKTAIAEIRPHKGEQTTVATFEINNALELADLRNPREKVTPFGLEEDELKLIYTNLPFLELLGEELSKPIIPRKANLEYLSSQYLSEILKSIGFHGIIYKSSVSNGDNYVVFDDSKLNPIETKQYSVTNVYTEFNETEVDS